jgi:hypothetical protein
MIVVASLFAIVAAGQQPGQEAIRANPEHDLVARISRIIGDTREDCGRLLSPGTWGQPAYRIEDLRGPIECAQRAAQARKAFVVVLKTLGFDSWTATGLLGGPDGAVQMFTYDNLYGQGTLRVSSCQSPTAAKNPDGFVYIACENRQANIQMQPARRMMLAGARLIWRR